MTRGEDGWREHGLVEAARDGDERAWAVLYEESFPGLYAFVLWRCSGMKDRADEIVQDVWLTAVRRLGSFKPSEGSFATWLRGIAVNILRNYFRRPEHKRTPCLNSEADVPEPCRDAERDRAERVALALIELPERYEAVLRAKYLDGLSVQAIAEINGESEKTVESLLSRARQAFREIYEQQEQP